MIYSGQFQLCSRKKYTHDPCDICNDLNSGSWAPDDDTAPPASLETAHWHRCWTFEGWNSGSASMGMWRVGAWLDSPRDPTLQMWKSTGSQPWSRPFGGDHLAPSFQLEAGFPHKSDPLVIEPLSNWTIIMCSWINQNWTWSNCIHCRPWLSWLGNKFTKAAVLFFSQLQKAIAVSSATALIFPVQRTWDSQFQFRNANSKEPWMLMMWNP